MYRGPISMSAQPRISVVLPTDTYETIARVLDRLNQSEFAEQCEIVLVTKETDELRTSLASSYRFHSISIVSTSSLSPLGPARACGILSASAELVFIGETHSYLWPEALGRLTEVLENNDADIALPVFLNGNPDRVISWSAFLAAYSRWGIDQSDCELCDVPPYNFVASRKILAELASESREYFSNGALLIKSFEQRKLRYRTVPAARIDHVNLEPFSVAMDEFYLQGVRFAAERRTRWSFSRCFVYASGSFLVPILLLWRQRQGILSTFFGRRAPLLALANVPLLYIARAFGEFTGYIFGQKPGHLIRTEKYEVRRHDYAGSCLDR